MAYHPQLLTIVVALLTLVPPIQPSPLFWPWWYYQSSTGSTGSSTSTNTSAASGTPSNIGISIGNRVNTNTGLDDYGTTIDGLTINLMRWRGNLTLVKNGHEVNITRGTNDTTIIRVGFGSASPTQASTNSTAAVIEPSSINSTDVPSSRRKRAAPSIPTLPSIPIPTLNGSTISLDGGLIRMSNLSVDLGSSLQQPWQFIKQLIGTGRSLIPLRDLDSLVQLLSGLYSSRGKRIVNEGAGVFNATLDYLSVIVNAGLGMATDQAAWVVQSVSSLLYNGLTDRSQGCQVDTPADAGRRVVGKVTGCIQERWDEVVGIVKQFSGTLAITDNAFEGWLKELSGCNARNFVNVSSSEQEIAQSGCYVQATAVPAIRILTDVPIRWANLTIRTASAVANFKPQVDQCVANVAAEASAVSFEIGLRIMQCQMSKLVG